MGSVFCNTVFDTEKKIGELGMLAAKDEFCGKGLGNGLISQAEARAKHNGCTNMRLELLTPRDWEHPVKVILDKWYTKVGYVKGDTEDFDKSYPHISPMLACPMNFTVYLKPLKKGMFEL